MYPSATTHSSSPPCPDLPIFIFHGSLILFRPLQGPTGPLVTLCEQVSTPLHPSPLIQQTFKQAQYVLHLCWDLAIQWCIPIMPAMAAALRELQSDGGVWPAENYNTCPQSSSLGRDLPYTQHLPPIPSASEPAVLWVFWPLLPGDNVTIWV